MNIEKAHDVDLNILFLEDSPADFELVEKKLYKAGYLPSAG